MSDQRRKHHREAVAGIQAKSAAYRAEQDRRQQQATQEAIPGQLQQLNSRPDYDTSRYVTRSQAQRTEQGRLM